MADAELICPKCGGEMVRGFTLDTKYAGWCASRWVQGIPKLSFWTGIAIVPQYKILPVASFRCGSCGFLESYARKEFATQRA